MKHFFKSFSSPIGPLILVANEKALVGIFWNNQSFMPNRFLNLSKASGHPLLLKAAQQLRAYFNGRITSFNLPLDFYGTEFQKKVWGALLKIPYGKTTSYEKIANSVKATRAYRAVGTACKKNPFAILVPCHRVIGKSGTLKGYAGGLLTKKTLLDFESNPSKTFQFLGNF